MTSLITLNMTFLLLVFLIIIIFLTFLKHVIVGVATNYADHLNTDLAVFCSKSRLSFAIFVNLFH